MNWTSDSEMSEKWLSVHFFLLPFTSIIHCRPAASFIWSPQGANVRKLLWNWNSGANFSVPEVQIKNLKPQRSQVKAADPHTERTKFMDWISSKGFFMWNPLSSANWTELRSVRKTTQRRKTCDTVTVNGLSFIAPFASVCSQHLFICLWCKDFKNEDKKMHFQHKKIIFLAGW